jgi:Cu-Zn family superoxide dismutase
MGLFTSKELTKLVCIINNDKVKGVVYFKKILVNMNNAVEISYDIIGLNVNSLHGFHIHQAGDLTDNCESLCSHYNPHNKQHGGLYDVDSHAGDLGNIQSDMSGRSRGKFTTSKFTLEEILGRSIVVHLDVDDLGRGPYSDSLTTGHSGKRIGCGIIGISKDCKSL